MGVAKYKIFLDIFIKKKEKKEEFSIRFGFYVNMKFLRYSADDVVKIFRL
jgi:hypothetical protein